MTDFYSHDRAVKIAGALRSSNNGLEKNFTKLVLVDFVRLVKNPVGF